MQHPEQPQSTKDSKTTFEQRLQHLQRHLQAQDQQQQQQLHLQHLPATEESSCSLTAEITTATTADVAYEADVDDDVPSMSQAADVASMACTTQGLTQAQKLQTEREHIYELFQPWALKTYGDQAKTKTITLRKKVRILKALEGKEHSRPDSSKFRFWVKTKAFTTKRPEHFEETPSSRRKLRQLPPNAVLSDHPSEVDLFVVSLSKESGKRIYRKVAVVEEFFDIIFGVHMELGGRSGMHAGQKRTYRIISETYAFLPREAVTRFLSTCPECKKNLRPSSPAISTHTEEPAPNESSSEVEVLNYSSHTESSAEAGPTLKSVATKAVTTKTKKRRHSLHQYQQQKQQTETIFKTYTALKLDISVEQLQSSAAVPEAPHSMPTRILTTPSTQQTDNSVQTKDLTQKQQQLPTSVPRIRVNPLLQRPLTPPLTLREPYAGAPPLPFGPHTFDANLLKSRDSLFRYYEFMRRFYSGSFMPATTSLPATQSAMGMAGLLAPVLTTPMYGAGELLQSLRFPQMPVPQSVQSATPSTAVSGSTIHEAVTTKIVLSDDEEEEGEEAARGGSAPKKQKLASSSTEAQGAAAQKLAIEATTSSRPIFSTTATDTPNLHPTSSISIPTPVPFPVPVPTCSTIITPSTQSSAINLSKYFRSNGRTLSPPTTSTFSRVLHTSTPTCQPQELATGALKIVATTTPIRVPKLRAGTQSAGTVATTLSSGFGAPLDLERLKPITSTYLQLTRSMGLSDEDALRFDNLVSKDFKYTL